VVTIQHALRFEATLAGLAAASTALRAILDARQLHEDLRYDVELVFEEISANIVLHARPSGDIEVDLAFNDEVVLTFEDDGPAFDPRQAPERPLPASTGEARVGGLGLVLIRHLCSRIDYTRTNERRNRLTVALPAR
jgi:anti-sigma regulatory factor (Ser/Thr protein kinase)